MSGRLFRAAVVAVTLLALISVLIALSSALRLRAFQHQVGEFQTALAGDQGTIAQLEIHVARRAQGLRSLWDAASLSDNAIQRLVDCDFDQIERVRPESRPFPYLVLMSNLARWRFRISDGPVDDATSVQQQLFLEGVDARGQSEYESFFGRAPPSRLQVFLAFEEALGPEGPARERACGLQGLTDEQCFEKFFPELSPELQASVSKILSEDHVRNDIEEAVVAECMKQVGVLEWSVDNLSALPGLP